MNRQQRRNAKKNGHKVIPRSVAHSIFRLTMAKADTTIATEHDADELTITPLVQIDRLASGKLDDSGFVDLNEANIAGFCLGKRIHEFSANQETKDIITHAQPFFEAAADALASIGERKAKIGRYTAKGDELEAIRESLRIYREAILVSEKGHIMHALIQAKEMVESKLLKVWREHQPS